jgi:hypothetical protein
MSAQSQDTPQRAVAKKKLARDCGRSPDNEQAIADLVKWIRRPGL